MAQHFVHPSQHLDPALVAVLREAAPAAERAGCLQPSQLAVIHRAGWLRAALPRALGGADLGLPALLELEEALAWADGSTGWVVTLCAGAAWFAGFLDPALATRVLAEDAA
ncbi:MAG: acyl-CoA dehydrogenase, partial [Gammaproteobacteria bacterium]